MSKSCDDPIAKSVSTTSAISSVAVVEVQVVIVVMVLVIMAVPSVNRNEKKMPMTHVSYIRYYSGEVHAKRKIF